MQYTSIYSTTLQHIQYHTVKSHLHPTLLPPFIIMSWFGGAPSTADLDAKVAEATSELIPDGEVDLPVALEITDVIRSKKVAPKLCMRSLKKRLTMVYSNPNLLKSTLKLIDLCVKNGGHHFLTEISSKEFVDYLIDYVFKVHYDTKKLSVFNSEAKLDIGMLILSLLKEWSQLLNLVGLGYLGSRCTQLVHQGYEFPQSSDIPAQFADAEVPPDWVDANECMICYNAFSVLNRKHHCRSCGGVFCQTHSSHTSPLVSLGIMEPVRVCDNCYEQIKLKNSGNLSKVRRSKVASDQPMDEDEQLRRAIELSLKDSGQTVSQPQAPPPGPPSTNNEDNDDEMKAALAASLREFEQQEAAYKNQTAQPPQQKQHLSLYDNLLPSLLSDVPQASYPSSSSNPFSSEGAPKAQAPPPLHQDLTQADEDAINVFVTLMSGVRTDRSKQANILYDNQLNDLHNRVVQLKPKLNRATREAIERYETFLEMNNKILTITRLYDQYLESKLTSLYGSHNINQDPWNSQPQFESQHTGYLLVQQPGHQPAHQPGHQLAQPTGPTGSTPQYPSYPAYSQPQYEPEQSQNHEQYTGEDESYGTTNNTVPEVPYNYAYGASEPPPTTFRGYPLEPPETESYTSPENILPRNPTLNIYPTRSLSPQSHELSPMEPLEPLVPPERQNTADVEARFPPLEGVSYQPSEPTLEFPTIPTSQPRAHSPPKEEPLIEL